MGGGSSTGSGYFWVRRLHSLAGLLLSIAFLICFIIPYSAAFGGPASFDRMASFIARIPFLDLLALALVVAPLLLHAAVGFAIISGSQFNVISSNFYRNWMYALQRITGVLLVPFLLYHIVKTQLAFAFTGRFADYAFLQRLLAPGWVRALYIAGVLCAAFHIGNGISVALFRWGITVSRRSRDAASMVLWVVTLVLAAWGVRIVQTF